MMLFMDVEYSLYYYVFATVLYSFILCLLNQISVRRHLKYRQEAGKTFLRPIAASIIMGAAAYGVYQGLFYLCKINIIALAAAVAVGGMIYFVLVIRFKAVTEEEMQGMPKGYMLIGIAKKLRIMKEDDDKSGKKGVKKKKILPAQRKFLEKAHRRIRKADWPKRRTDPAWIKHPAGRRNGMICQAKGRSGRNWLAGNPVRKMCPVGKPRKQTALRLKRRQRTGITGWMIRAFCGLSLCYTNAAPASRISLFNNKLSHGVWQCLLIKII